jgi:general stress protein 26
LVGPATLLEEASEVRQRWKSAYDVYFPTDQDRATAALIEVEIQRMELWIRGLTPEPFGFRATTVERDGRGAWRLTP